MGADDQDGGDRAGDSDREDRRTDRRSPDQLKVFVGGLPHEYDDRDLRDAFRKFEPSSAQVMRDKATNRSRHFGFVHFTDRRLMEEAIKELDGSMLEGKAISVKRAVPQEHVPPGTPASELERGRRRDRWPPRDYRYDRYDRAPHYDYPPAGAPYERMPYADRGAYPPSRSYDPYFDRGYDRGPQYYPGMRGFEDPYMRDPYGRDLYGRPMPGMEPPDRFRDPYRDAGYGREMFDRGAMGSAYDRAAFPMPGDRGFDRDDRYDRYSPDSRAGGPERGFDPRSPRYAARGPAIYDRAAAPDAGLRPGSPPRAADMSRR